MEVEAQKAVQVMKSDQYLVKVAFMNAIQNKENVIEIMKEIAFEKLKINIVNVYQINESNNYICIFESSDDSRLFASYDFLRENMSCETKLLTKNDELDNRKVKIWRPAYGNIDLKDLKCFLTKYGEIDESLL